MYNIDSFLHTIVLRRNTVCSLSCWGNHSSHTN